MEEDKEGRHQKVFINAQVLESSGNPWTYEEDIFLSQYSWDVERPEKVVIQYVDESFKQKTEMYEGINARVIQHEYDHIEGKLFIEMLGPVKKKMIQRKISDIKQGKIVADYKIKFAQVKVHTIVCIGKCRSK